MNLDDTIYNSSKLFTKDALYHLSYSSNAGFKAQIIKLLSKML